jgi:hypothetical protein
MTEQWVSGVKGGKMAAKWRFLACQAYCAKSRQLPVGQLVVMKMAD